MTVRAAQAALRRGFEARACASRAEAAQRYMKSALPYYGLPLAEVRTVSRRVWDEHPFATRDEWLAAARQLWEETTHREEWYAVVNLLRHRRYRGWADDPRNLATLRHLVVTGAWWDVVDELASHCVGTVLRAHPAAVAPVLRRWATEPNLWVRRTAILSQLNFKDATDPALLVDCLLPSIPDQDFFARKAIGWALRTYARTDPAWVRRFVDEHPELSGLSKREALKHLG